MTVVKFIGLLLLFFLANTEQVTMALDLGGRHSKDNRLVGISVKVTKGPVRQKTSVKAG